MSNQPPQFGATSLYQIPENQTTIAALAASDDADAVGAGLSFSIVGGPDGAGFAVNAATGDLRFVSAPDFENPTDVGANNVYDLTVRVTDSGGLHSDKQIQVQVTDLKTLQIAITTGQSLAIGGTATRGIVNPTPLYPNNVLGMSFNSGATALNTGWQAHAVDPLSFKGFAPLKETGSETHVSGMLDALVSRYNAAGMTAPTFLNINVAIGGFSILQLMTGSQHIYQTLQDALNHETNGSVFAVNLNNGTCDFYVDNGGSATFFRNLAGPPTAFDNAAIQLQLAINYARANGYEVDPTVILNVMQGQQDNGMNVANFGYDYLLDQLINRVTNVVHNSLGANSGLLSVISQIRSSGSSEVPIDQLNEILSRPDVILGSTEFSLEAEYPSDSGNNAMDYLHLTPTGYYFYGQTIGNNIFDALMGNENTPIIMDKITQISDNSVIVHFSGVNSYLIDDPSHYLAANGLHAPHALGFGLFTPAGNNVSGFQIASARIVGVDTVEVDFTAPISGTVRLQLGRNDEDLYSGQRLLQLGGTSLRDASAIPSLHPTSGITLADPYIYEFPPDQYLTVTFSTAPTHLRVGTDLDSDLVSDVLFRSSSGDLAGWQLAAAGTVSASGAIGNPGAGWRYAASGDFSGDGKTDLLFSGTGGTLATWEMNGSAVTGGATLGNPGTDLAVVGTGYFNADWQSDILFQNRLTGAYSSWDIKAGKIAGGGTIGNPGAAWVYKATGDFNGDGKSRHRRSRTSSGSYRRAC